MEKLEKEWIEHPILHLDLNIEKYDSPQSLEDILEKAIVSWEKLYGAEPSERSLSLRFAGVIERACKLTGHRVVILVDEYDKPMLQSIGDEECKRVSQDLASLLWSYQNNGWIHPVRFSDRCHQVW